MTGVLEFQFNTAEPSVLPREIKPPGLREIGAVAESAPPLVVVAQVGQLTVPDPVIVPPTIGALVAMLLTVPNGPWVVLACRRNSPAEVAYRSPVLRLLGAAVLIPRLSPAVVALTMVVSLPDMVVVERLLAPVVVRLVTVAAAGVVPPMTRLLAVPPVMATAPGE